MLNSNGLKFATIVCTVEYVQSGRRNLLLVETTADVFITKGSNNWQRSAVNEHNISAMHSDVNDHENRETLGDQFQKHVVHKILDDNPLKQCLARMSENEHHMLV